MSEQEKQAAIAKIKARGCRRWMTLLIIAPVFLCAALALIGPNIQEYLARAEAQQKCQSLTNDSEASSNTTIFATDDISGEAIITADNIEQMLLFEEVTLASPVQRQRIEYSDPIVNHPTGDYFLYAEYRGSSPTNFFICTEAKLALGAFTADETAHIIAFNTDGTLFAVADSRTGTVMLFDGVEIRRLETINVRGTQQFRQIDSIAFHPTEPLLFFSSEDELFVYETGNFAQIITIPISETDNHEIGFNAEGTRFFMSAIGEAPLASVWGIRE